MKGQGVWDLNWVVSVALVCYICQWNSVLQQKRICLRLLRFGVVTSVKEFYFSEQCRNDYNGTNCKQELNGLKRMRATTGEEVFE